MENCVINRKLRFYPLDGGKWVNEWMSEFLCRIPSSNNFKNSFLMFHVTFSHCLYCCLHFYVLELLLMAAFFYDDDDDDGRVRDNETLFHILCWQCRHNFQNQFKEINFSSSSIRSKKKKISSHASIYGFNSF